MHDGCLQSTHLGASEGPLSGQSPRRRPLLLRLPGHIHVAQGEVVAEGLGCAGFYADSMAELETVLDAAREAAGPALVCVRTDRAANMSVPLASLQRFGEVYQGPMG